MKTTKGDKYDACDLIVERVSVATDTLTTLIVMLIFIGIAMGAWLTFAEFVVECSAPRTESQQWQGESSLLDV